MGAGGEAHDCPVAERVNTPKRMLGDKAYDSAKLRDDLCETSRSFPIAATGNSRSASASVRTSCAGASRAPSKHAEGLQARIATRYDRLARDYLASVCLAAALVRWI
jgi:hypothetical protein